MKHLSFVLIAAVALSACATHPVERVENRSKKATAPAQPTSGDPVTFRSKRVFLGITPVPTAASTPAKPATDTKTVTVKSGDSLRTALESLADKSGYAVDWTGPDLFFKQDARFDGETFQEVANKILTASRLIGYMNKDEGKVLHVFVQ